MKEPTMTELTNLSGQTIKGFELLERIGVGGFGEVYRAFQPSVRREVAVKIILPEFVNNPDFVRRFEAEAQLVAHLEHPYIVPLYDYWRDATGAYLVMRWFRGGSLQEVLDKGHWPIQDAARIVDQICSALAALHRNGVIHRDLKPANILLDEEKNAYLADFGIAKDLLHIADVSLQIEADEEESGGFYGSPDYVSPEQIMQAPVTPQSDIYNMGLLLYKLFTGRRPYEGVPLSTLISKHLQEPLPHLNVVNPDLSEELNQVIRKATEKEPSRRYSDILALAADLRHALSLTPQDKLTELEYRSPDAFSPEQLGIPSAFLSTKLSELEPENPYKGLRAFQEVDADDFFGREKLVDALLEKFKGEDRESRFMVVIGPSGSGKSSVIKAGILPKLRKGGVEGSADWFIVEMTPGAHPMEELEAALLRVAINPPASLLPQLNEDERGLARAVKRVLPNSHTSELVLLIDQFEEAFTQTEDEAQRLHFLNSLVAATQDSASRLRVIVTLRADFYDRPLSYPYFGELVRECTQVVLPLSREELERAIVEPAERNGIGLEVGLAASIIADVGEQPGSLPLLQYALTELFERRDGRWLTVQAYKDIGGVMGALARRADEIYNQLDPESQNAAKQLFLRLVTLGEGSEDTRRRPLISELLSLQIDSTVMQKVIDVFGKYRLLTFDRDPITRTPTIEVAHEALIRRWTTFRQWLNDTRDDLQTQRRLAASTEEWVTSRKDTSYLASGSRLEQFEEWNTQTELALSDVEREYLRDSLALREKQRAEEAARSAREAAIEQRSRRILTALLVGTVIAMIGAFVLSGFAFNQQQVAIQNAVTATVAQGVAIVEANNAATQAANAASSAQIARNLAFVSGAQLALASNNTDLAILLALQANQNGQSTLQTRRTLAEVGYAPGTRAIFTGHTDRVSAVAYSPDGTTALSGARDNKVILTELVSGQIVYEMSDHTDWVWDVVYSPDGKVALSASQDKTLILWDLATGNAIRTLSGHTDGVRAIAFNADGTQALSGSADKTLLLWDVTSGEMLRKFEGSQSVIHDVAFSTSGFTALSAGQDGNIILWNVNSGLPIFTYGSDAGGHTAEAWSVAYTPDELGFISSSQDGLVLLWSFETGSPIRRFIGHNGRVTSVAFSPNGKQIVSGSEDNSLILWDTATAAILHRFIGHTFLVYGVAFSPNGEHILSSSWDGTVRWWDITEGSQLAQLGSAEIAHKDSVTSIAYSPDGTLSASASYDGSVIIWDMSDNQPLKKLSGHVGRVHTVTFSSDGTLIASGADDQTIIVWDATTGEQIATFTGHSDAVWALDFSADGTMLASGSRDNTIILWDVATESKSSVYSGIPSA